MNANGGRMATVLGIATLWTCLAEAQVPARINYQGRLLQGTNLVNGVTNIVTRLYSASSGGSPMYVETNASVVISDGLYTLVIGDEASGLATALTNNPVYLEIAVGAQTLTPREALAAVAYAITAAGVQNGGVTTAMLADSAVDSAKIKDGAILDADVNAVANINPGKISGTALTQVSPFNGDVAGPYNNLQLTAGAILDADVNIAAAVNPAKIAGTALTQGTLFNGDVAGQWNNLQLTAGAILDADVNAAAAIAPAKILGTALTQGTGFGGDVAGLWNNLQIAPGTIMDADVNAAAGINPAKIQNTALTTTTAFNGDVTGAYNALNIAVGAVGSSEILDGSITTNDLNVVSVDGRYLRISGGVMTGPLTNASGFYGNGVGLTNLPYLLTSVWVTADSTTNYVRRTGDRMSGNLNMGGNIISNAVFRGDGAGITGLVLRVALSNVIWVAVNGTAAGPGTIDKPYNTPQNGYNAAVAGGAVVIASGVYPGALNMANADIHVMGLGRPVIQGALTYGAAATTGRVLLQNLMFTGGASMTGSKLKCFNCRIEGGTTLTGASEIEFQSCYLREGAVTPALWLQPACSRISVNNSSLEGIAMSTFVVASGCTHIEMIGCEVAVPAQGPPAIDDQQAQPISPQHLYTHNHIRAPMPGGLAVLAGGGQTIAFFHNTVQGSLSPVGVAEFFAANVVIGVINWGQAEPAAAQDNWGNVTFAVPQLPDPWED